MLQTKLQDAQKIVVTWNAEDGKIRKAFGEGRFLIGGSHFCHVRIGAENSGVSGFIQVLGDQVTIKCVASEPVLYADGRKMAPGEVIVVGDVIEFVVASTSVKVAVSHSTVGTFETKSECQSFDDELDRLFADIDSLKVTLSRKLLDQLNLLGFNLAQLDSPEVRETARLKLRKIITDIELPDNFQLTKETLERQIFDEVMGLGPLEPLLADESVTEIMVNCRNQIFVERAGSLTLSPVHFSSDQALLNVIERIVSTVGRRIDQSSPIVDARLLDGSRVNAVIPPLALRGPNLTIRRFSKTPIAVDQLVAWGSLSQEMSDFLRSAVIAKKNIMISGGTGSGKTTLLNALSNFVPEDERIITVEDAAELRLQQEHVISLESRPANLEGKGAITIRDLVKNTLRMRPDRIIVGECRGGEAIDMLQAMNTGHDGSMSTAHANSPMDMLRRLETMVMMSGMELPLVAIREQITSAVTLVVQQTRRKSGKRVVSEICWIRGLEPKTNSYLVTPIFTRDRSDAPVVDVEAVRAFAEEAGIDDLSNLKLGGL